MIEYLKKETNFTTTENGACTHKTSNSYVLDYFAQGSALRSRGEQSILGLFTKSFMEDPLLTMKILFYSRDIRGGQGERNTFKVIIKYLANNHRDVMKKNLYLVPEFGRWDDLYALYGTKLEKDMFELIKKQLKEDIKSETPSLLGKWLKSENTSCKESRFLGMKTREALEMTPKEYRQTLSLLRKKIDIVETKISKKDYEDIDYSRVPSNANLKYRHAFSRNDGKRYNNFLELLTKGKTKVNTEALFPYQLVAGALNNPTIEEQQLLNALWSNLPDYIGENKENNIAVIDTSGSMSGVPIQVGISLGLYLAEKNKGVFKNHFITFADEPELVEVIGATFCEKVNNIIKANWGMSTNIESTFNLILETAVKHNLSKDELPSRLFIISDMEFNEIESYDYDEEGYDRQDHVLFDIIDSRFKKHGYKMPKIVFWNVNSRNDNIPMTMNDEGVQLVSGSNPILFHTLLKNEFLGAYDIMFQEIGKERYNCITI